MYVIGIGRTKFGTLKDTMPELKYQAMYWPTVPGLGLLGSVWAVSE